MWGSKKQKKHVFTGFPGDCSPQQLQSLQQFRVIAIKLNDGIQDKRFNDVDYLRFLRARKFSLPQTQKMWKNYIDWRIKTNIQQIYYFSFPQLNRLRKQYPHGYHKVDKQYRPIYIERVGKMNIDSVFGFTTPERLLNYFTLSYETLLTKIFSACTEMKKRQTGQQGQVFQTCTILDLKDIHLTMANKAYNIIKPISQMSQDNYPEILGNMFIVNAPFLFTGIWQIVKMWLDDKTKEKIKIIGGSYKKQLLAHIDAENLPDFLDGGKCSCQGGDCLSRNIGPWNPKGEELFPYATGQKNIQKQKAHLKQQQQQKLLIQAKQQQKKSQEEQLKQKTQTIMKQKQQTNENKKQLLAVEQVKDTTAVEQVKNTTLQQKQQKIQVCQVDTEKSKEKQQAKTQGASLENQKDQKEECE